MEKEGILKIIYEEGVEKEFHILFTFDSPETREKLCSIYRLRCK